MSRLIFEPNIYKQDNKIQNLKGEELYNQKTLLNAA